MFPHRRRDFRIVVHRAVVALLFCAAVGLSLVLNCVGLGESSLFSDEAIYAVSARQAAANDQWYPLRYLQTPYVTKPPLAVWPVAASFKLWGVGEFTDRIPSAIAAALLVGVVFLCAAWLLGCWAAFFAAVLLATCPPWLAEHGARNGVADPLFCLALAASLVMYQCYRTSGARRWLLAAGATAAISGLCKGLLGPALLLFATVIVEAIWWRWYSPNNEEGRSLAASSPGAAQTFSSRHAKERLVAWRYPLLLFLLGTVPYLIWVCDTFVRMPAYASILYGDIVTRALHGLDPAHLHGPTYYAYILSYALDHWGLILLPLGFAVTLRQRHGYHARALALIAVWAIVVVLTLSCSVSKLPWYIFPALPAFAILVAAAVREIVAYLAPRPWLKSAALFAFGCLLADRVDAAWQLVRQPPRTLAAQRIAYAFSALPDARLYAENFDGLLAETREWNAFYLAPLRAKALPLTALAGASGCRIVMTDDQNDQLGRLDLSTAMVIPLEKFDPREPDIVFRDLCEGRLRAALQTPIARPDSGR